MPEIVKPLVLDLLDPNPAPPALSSVTDVPVIETKPDAQNEGKPPDLAPAVPPKEEAKEPAPTEGEAEQQEESATSSTDEQSGQPAADKVPRGVGKRLAELTKRLDEERSERLRLLSLLEAKEKPAEAKVEQKQDPEPPAPVKSDFLDPDQWDQAMLTYAKDYASWSTRQAIAQKAEEDRRQAETSKIREEQDQTVKAYFDREAKVKEKYPDYDQVANQPVMVPAEVVKAIVNWPIGPEIKYYFGQNPQEAERFMQLPVQQQTYELGLIAAKLVNPPQPKPVSAAPPPIKPLKTSTETPPIDGENADMESYAASVRAREGWADPMRPKRGVRH